MANTKKTTKKNEMHRTNPKAARGKPKGELKDSLKETAEKSKSFFKRGWETFKEILAKPVNFAKAAVKKENINKYSNIGRGVLAGIMLICSMYVGIKTLLTYFTVQTIGLAAATGVVALYGVYRLTLREDIRKNTKPSIKEMISPVAMAS